MGFGDLTSYVHLSVFIYTKRWHVQARVVATEFLLFIYLRATYILAFFVAYLSIHILQSYISHSLYDLNTPLLLQIQVIPGFIRIIS